MKLHFVAGSDARGLLLWTKIKRLEQLSGGCDRQGIAGMTEPTLYIFPCNGCHSLRERF
jgi:hypothetical protein